MSRFDWVVVERLMSGRPARVHPDERDATARELVRRGMGRYQARLACSLTSTQMCSVLGVAA